MVVKVIYGDTDSIFVHGLATATEAEQLAKRVTTHLRQFTLAKYGVQIPLTMGVDKQFATFRIGTVKKKYIGTDAKTGEPIIKGYEERKRDTTELAKQIQREAIKLILADTADVTEAIKPYLRKVRADLFAGRVDNLLIFRKNLRRDLADYKRRGATGGLPPHVRAAQQLADKGVLEAYAAIEYVIIAEVKQKTGKGNATRKVVIVAPVIADKHPPIQKSGYDYVWRHQILPMLDRFDIVIDDLMVQSLGDLLADITDSITEGIVTDYKTYRAERLIKYDDDYIPEPEVLFVIV